MLLRDQTGTVCFGEDTSLYHQYDLTVALDLD